MTDGSANPLAMGKPFEQWLSVLERKIKNEKTGLDALNHFYEAGNLRKSTLVLADVASLATCEALKEVAEALASRALRCQIEAAQEVLSFGRGDRILHETMLRNSLYPAIVSFLRSHDSLDGETADGDDGTEIDVQVMIH
ncbi:MAG TPA: hypothetical protein VM661_12185 [Candidatus Sulfotelmatobacter sp.]|jgi:hypothetical protein|nr:hypothetical protein [Candidatus Sulfotelmatobacter sp.]